MSKGNPQKLGKTRCEVRIFSPIEKTADDYLSFISQYKQHVEAEKVMHTVKISTYYETIL